MDVGVAVGEDGTDVEDAPGAVGAAGGVEVTVGVSDGDVVDVVEVARGSVPAAPPESVPDGAVPFDWPVAVVVAVAGVGA